MAVNPAILMQIAKMAGQVGPSLAKLGVAVIPGKYERRRTQTLEDLDAQVAEGGSGKIGEDEDLDATEAAEERAKQILGIQMRGVATGAGPSGQAHEEYRKGARGLWGKSLAERSKIRREGLEAAQGLRWMASRLRGEEIEARGKQAEKAFAAVEELQSKAPAAYDTGKEIKDIRTKQMAGAYATGEGVSDLGATPAPIPGQ